MEVRVMEANERELEVLEEGRVDAEELNACCGGAQNRA
jgi:putative radical SAM-modified peptide